MSLKSHISLIDLSKQLPFNIDDALKKDLCFSETLVISCCHYEGEVVKDASGQSWTCSDSTSSHTSEKSAEEKFDLKDELQASRPSVYHSDSQASDDDEFHFYFFPKCPEQPTTQQDSTTSVILVDGIPRINEAYKEKFLCKCQLDNFGKCPCYMKSPCKCDILPKAKCTCGNKAINICECDSLLHPCSCVKGNKCTCGYGACICEEKLGPADVPVLKDEQSKSISIETPAVGCKCNLEFSPICTCFPTEEDVGEEVTSSYCICEDPENCKCNIECDCRQSVCDTKQIDNECISLNKFDYNDIEKKDPETNDTEIDDKLQTEVSRKLKRVSTSKEGYRWCHEVDPQHTFFDYGYDMHDKITYKEESKEKVIISGLHETHKPQEEVHHIDEIPIPELQTGERKPSIDCCSAVGGITISVETLGEAKDQFLVQVISHSSKEGAKTGTKLVSIVDCNLHTMEENRVEYITKADLTKERRNYIAICENGYYNKVSRMCGEHNFVKRLYHSFDDARDFLLEGANIVLLRYVALQRHRGNLKTHTVLMNGIICESLYVCHGVSQAVVNGKPMFVVKVDRYIMERNGAVHQTLTVLTLKGYTVNHEWSDSRYVMHLNPLLKIIPEKDEIEAHAPLRATWRQDLQLLSDYLDYKGERTSEGARYLSENGELSGAVCDYLQALLLLHPEDVLQFTRQYFGAALSALDLPHNDYFDPDYNALR